MVSIARNQGLSIAGSRCNSQTSLCLLQGKFEEAERLCLRSIDLKEKTVGPDHPSTAASLNNLAELFQTQARTLITSGLCVVTCWLYERTRERYDALYDVCRERG